MEYKILNNREVIPEINGKTGTQYENNVTVLNFDFSNLEIDVSDYTKYIFFYKDYIDEENLLGSDLLEDDTYTLKNNVTKYRNVVAQLVLIKDDYDWRSESFKITSYNSTNKDGELDEEELSALSKVTAEVEAIKTDVENGLYNGATFTPSVDEDCNLSWSNDKGLDNPATVNLKGDVRFFAFDIDEETGQLKMYRNEDYDLDGMSFEIKNGNLIFNLEVV